MTEKELFELASKQDEDAFNKLIENTLTKITASIFNNYNKLTPQDFEDARQNAVIKAWSKIATFRGESSFATWFYIILRNEVLNILKSRGQIRKYEISMNEMAAIRDCENTQEVENIMCQDINEAVIETAQTVLEKQDDIKTYRTMLKDVLDKLKPAHREVIKLVFEEEKTYEEASKELGVPLGTIMSRVFFARKNASDLIKNYANRNDLQLTCLG